MVGKNWKVNPSSAIPLIMHAQNYFQLGGIQQMSLRWTAGFRPLMDRVFNIFKKQPSQKITGIKYIKETKKLEGFSPTSSRCKYPKV